VTEQDQIKALAELDGLEITGEQCDPDVGVWLQCHKKGQDFTNTKALAVPEYLTSYDAIIPLIQKQEVWIRAKIAARHPQGITFMSSPAQLCEALLRATGRWTE
jgi:hypothetical protein